MKAFTVAHYGPDALQLSDVPIPAVGPHDVLVDVRAASINPLDTMVRNGEFKQLLKYKLPFVLGHDVAGVITQVGADVHGFTVGDEVYSRPRDLRIGTFAELIAIDADDVALKPRSLSFEEAGAVPLVALAAWQALVDVAHVKPGQKVLVHAGAGGLGSTVIQVAKHLGAHVATTAHTNDQDKVRGLGADDVIDYTQQDFADVLSGYDVVLDSLGGPNLEKSLTVLKPGGLAISVVGPPDPALRQAARPPDPGTGHGSTEPQGPQAGQEARGALLVLLHARRRRTARRPWQPCTTTAPCGPCWTGPSTSTRPWRRWRTSNRARPTERSWSPDEPTDNEPVITSYAQAPTRTVTTAGATYAYRELGPKGGIPVVFFVHLAANLDNWDPRIIDPIAQESARHHLRPARRRRIDRHRSPPPSRKPPTTPTSSSTHSGSRRSTSSPSRWAASSPRT